MVRKNSYCVKDYAVFWFADVKRILQETDSLKPDSRRGLDA